MRHKLLTLNLSRNLVTTFKLSSSNEKYAQACKALNLDTNFSSPNYKPLNEKEIRTAFRNQARYKHPDTDSIPDSTQITDEYHEIVQARDYLLQNHSNPAKNHQKSTQDVQYAYVEETPQNSSSNGDDSFKKYQKIDTKYLYQHNDKTFYFIIPVALIALFFALKYSDLPPPDDSINRYVSARQERRRKRFREREKERIEREKWKENAAHYEETDSCTGHIFPLTDNNDDEEDGDDIYIPKTDSSIMSFDQTFDKDCDKVEEGKSGSGK